MSDWYTDLRKVVRPIQIKDAAEALSQYQQDPIKPSWIYFAGGASLRVGEVIKIGRSVNIKRRMYAISRVCGFQMKVFATAPGYSLEEISIHDAFSDQRVEGEWYEVDQELLSFIDKHAVRVAEKETVAA